MNDFKKTFGARLKELRKSKKYTQEKLAEMLDLSARQLIRIENGQNIPTFEFLYKFSKIFEIEIHDLFDFKKDVASLGKSYQEPIIRSELYNNIQAKLDKISYSEIWLKYIETAIDSLADRESLEKLKTLIRGLDLLLPQSKTINKETQDTKK